MALLQTHPRETLLAIFVTTVIIALLAIMLLSYIAIRTMGGVRWSEDPNDLNNLHSVLMPIGSVFLVGIGSLIFRIIPKVNEKYQKLIHLVFNIIAFIFMIIGLAAALYARKLSHEDYRHFFSLHSWIGLVVFILFVVQFFSGIIAYVFKVCSKHTREYYFDIHAHLGFLIFLLAFLTTEIGIETKETLCFSENEEMLSFNIAGTLILIFVGAVLYMGMSPYFEWQQFFSGLFVFLFGLGSDEWRDYFAATHAFIGLLLFLLGFLVSEMGIVIKATFCLSQKANIGNELLAFNWVGAMILIFVAAMFYIGVCPYFEWEKIDDQ